MVTEYSLNESNGSILRVKRQVEGLKEHNLENVSIVDNFNKNSKRPKDSLIHAQQLTGQFFDKKTYIADIHGIAELETKAKTLQYPYYSWKKWAYYLKSYQYKKLENKVWKNSLHLICASDAIYDRVKHIQNATIVRPAVKMDEFITTKCNSLRVAVVGPFLPGTQNYDWKLISYCVKKLPQIEFVFIGSVDKFFKEKLDMKNSIFLGRVENYVEALSSCSVLLSPYPKSSHIIGSKTKMLEAGACQMPVITTPEGALGMPDNVIITCQNREEFIKKLQELNDDGIRRSIGKEFQKIVKIKYNADVEIKKLIKVYEEFLN